MKGSIEKRKGPQGVSYRVRVELPPDPVTNERRRINKTVATRKEAERLRAELVTEVNRGTAVEPSKMTVAYLLQNWLQTVAKHKVRATTFEDYESTINKHIIPHLGSVLVQRLTAEAILNYYSLLREKKAGNRTVQLCHLRLSQALTHAMKIGVIYQNPCKLIEAPQAPAAKGRVWTSNEVQLFLDKAEKDTYNPLWLLMISAGLRRGEALGVRWQDIDFSARTLRVTQSVVMVGGSPVIQRPKSAAAQRVVKLSPEMIDALKSHKKAQNEQRLKLGELWQEHDLVFCTAEGKVLNPNNIYRNFLGIVDQAGVPRIRIHDLRHTHATLLLAAGQPIKVVSERLGHAKTSITLDTYAHVMPDMQDQAVEALGELIFKKKSA